MSDEQATPVGHEAQLTALETAARDRWGEAWGLRILQFADGSINSYAFHSYGRTDEGYLERERLIPVEGEDEPMVVREVYELEQTVDSELIYDPRGDDREE